MPCGYRQHGHRNQPAIFGPVRRRPHCKDAFAEVSEQGYEKTGPSQETTNIFGPDASAALLANVESRAHADQIIAGRETTEHVSAHGDPACLVPVCRLNLLNPRHS